MPHLYVAELKQLEFADLAAKDFIQIEIGSKIVFEDYDGNGALVSCKGLKQFIETRLPLEDQSPDGAQSSDGVPLYIFDNHNHAFYFWHRELIRRNIHPGATLIHVDQHKDARLPEKYLAQDLIYDEEAVFKYTNEVLNVGNFIPAAQKDGLIGEVINIDSEDSLRKCHEQFNDQAKTFSSINNETSFNDPVHNITPNIILDIDLDFLRRKWTTSTTIKKSPP